MATGDNTNDIGIKVSQLGKSVENSKDYELLFSSSWPTLKIAFQGSFTIPDQAVDTIMFEHNLGYYPAFSLYYADDGFGVYASNYAGSERRIGINKTHLKFFTDTYRSGPLTIYYYIYLIDVELNFTAPKLDANSASSYYIKDYGFKIAKEGKDINSTDLRDYVIHSGTLTPTIHSVTTGNTLVIGEYSNTGEIVVKHDLGYVPYYYAFYKYIDYDSIYIPGIDRQNNYYFQVGGGHQTYPAIFITDVNSITVTLPAPTGVNSINSLGSIIVFKDPFELDLPIIETVF